MCGFRVRGAPLLLALVAGCGSLAIDDELGDAVRLLGVRGTVEPDWSSDAHEPRPRDPSVPLTLTEATRRALATHPRIVGEIARLASARADLVQARLLPNPVLSVAIGIPTDGGGGSPLAASLVQQLSALWTRPARIHSAEAELRARVLRLSDAALRLAAEVRTLHAEVVHGERRGDIDAALLTAHDRRVQLREAQFAAGEGTQREVNAARLDQARAVDRSLAGDEWLGQARRRLSERIGEPGADTSTLELDGSSLPSVTVVLQESEVFRLAAEQRLDVAAAFAAVEGARARQRLEEWTRWGAVSPGVGFERNFSNRTAVFPSVSVGPDLFGSSRTARARARAVEQRSQAAADGLLREALLEARLAHLALSVAAQRCALIDEQWLPPARENLALAKQSYAAGEGTLLAVLDDEIRWLEVDREGNEARLALRRAYFELERSVGGAVDGALAADGPRPGTGWDASRDGEERAP